MMSVVNIASELISFETPSQLSNIQISQYLEDLLRQREFEIELVDYKDANGVPKRNLVAKKGKGAGGLAYFGHSDTVPSENWTFEASSACEGLVKDRRLYGRGSCDMKGSVACALVAAERFRAEELNAPFYFICTADEEVGSVGALHVAQHSQLFQEMVSSRTKGIIGEPTRQQVIYAHKGSHAFAVTSKGVAAHSSRKEGVNANLKMIPFLSAMRDLYHETETNPQWQNEEFDPPTLCWNIGINDHNLAVNITADKSVCTVYFRPMPGIDVTPLWEQVESLAEQTGLQLEVLFKSDPVYIDPSTAFVREMLELTKTETPRTVGYGTDGVMLTSLDELVVCGPGDIAQAHTSDEWIDLNELETGVDLYERAIQHWCCHL